MGTKASKAIAVLSALIPEKASIFKGYNGLMLVDDTNSNTISYLYVPGGKRWCNY